MPSLVRRILVTAVYLICGFVLFVLTEIGVTAAGWVTVRCFDGALCSARENAILDGVALGWVAVSALLIAAGWRGWLWGARRGPAA